MELALSNSLDTPETLPCAPVKWESMGYRDTRGVGEWWK